MVVDVVHRGRIRVGLRGQVADSIVAVHFVER
jgi:hypothetical protein